MEYVSQFNKLIDKISSETKVEIPKGFKYRYSPRRCWKCDKEILVFRWYDSILMVGVEEPPEPIPLTIQKRHTQMRGESYWTNTCPYCNSVQGDFFINHEPDSALIVLGEIANDKESFESDMKRVAEYYYQQII